MWESDDKDDADGRAKRALYIEDAVILLALIPLFILGVFYRSTEWGQAGLWAVFAVMLVVFVIRLRRTHRAFKGHDDP